jgi:hypothetical protein
VGLYRKHCFSGLLPLGRPYQKFDDQQLFTSNSIDTTVLHLKRSNLLSSNPLTALMMDFLETEKAGTEEKAAAEGLER